MEISIKNNILITKLGSGLIVDMFNMPVVSEDQGERIDESFERREDLQVHLQWYVSHELSIVHSSGTRWTKSDSRESDKGEYRTGFGI